MTDLEILELPDTETTCSICYAEFLDPDDLSVHIAQVHSKEEETTFKLCQFCTKYSASLDDYAVHIRDKHILSLKCCKYCNRVFDDFDEYRKHEAKHYLYVARGRYSCSQCPELFNNISELELHEKRLHPDGTEGVFITDCLPLLSSLLNIRALKFLHSFGEEVVYMCVICKLSTHDVHEYIQHLKTLNCRSLACNNCSSVFRVKDGLVRHIQSHPECYHGAKRQSKQCLECYKMFDITMWRDHTKHCKVIKCRTCELVFPTMYDLSQHQSQIHPLTVMLEACKYCHREFAGSAAVEKHIERAHKSDMHLYKYSCTSCGAIFKHPKKLFAHFYSTHKDLEPYTCTICDKKFRIRKRFTIHIKLDHKSIGYTEFDENYHVFFSDKKSDKSTKDSTKSNDDNSQETLLNKGIKKDKDSLAEMNTDQKENDNEKVDTPVKTDSKVKENVQEKPDNTLHDNTSDFMSATETEDNQTEVESKAPRLKRKLKGNTVGKSTKRPKKIAKMAISDSSDDDDQPLLKLQKKIKNHRIGRLRNATWNNKKQVVKDNKKRFICDICKKYCYTFQNYHNHVALHYNNASLKCVKCSQKFTSKEELNVHYEKAHATSQLTKTLKNLLEKRKNSEPKKSDRRSSSEKFQMTIKKVLTPPTEQVQATVTEIKNKLSVQKFIESFTPEETPKKKLIEIDSSVSMKPSTGPPNEPLIKMTKCNLTHPVYTKAKLSMPIRYRQVVGETHKVTVRQVFVDDAKSVTDEVEDRCNDEIFQDDTYLDDTTDADNKDQVPEVAQEVMLEETATLHIPHRVVLPKLPKEYNKIHIAHLQAEAPYYKIVKVDEVLKNGNKNADSPSEKNIQLPDGTKLVTVNPLAHLLGGTSVEKILENSKSKYYTPKAKDFEVAIAKAMLRLEKPHTFPKKKRRKRVPKE